MRPAACLPLLLLLACTAPVRAQHAIIPVPVRTAIQPGAFHIDEKTVLLYDSDSADVRAVAEYLQQRIARASSFTPALRRHDGGSVPRNSIFLTLRDPDPGADPEGYALRVSPHGARVISTTAAGLFYGVQTMRQLLPPRFESTARPDTVRGWDLTCCLIVDAPRFPWRGLLLDCARHFMDVEFIKHTLDVMALLKMNRLHWHLTDDQGWRLEIRRHPRLTSVGAWRDEADGSRYGGYYTQEQVRDIVAYAAERHITIVPEIEMPGHARAALAAYPALSCTGEALPVPHTWGVFDDVFCAGSDDTFRMLEEVLDEVITLFPSPYIHIGGDEVPKTRWAACDRCQARMREEGLADEVALQSWFVARIERFLTSRGRRMIGWDEILEGGLPPRATVQSWRGMQGAITATKAGHEAIVSPTSHAYFDYPLRSIDLERVYSFSPVPNELKAAEQERVLGGECNMWTEHAPQHIVEEKIYPRMLAMAEVLWTPALQRNFHAFRRRLQDVYERLDTLGVRYGFEAPPVRYRSAYDSADGLQVRVIPGQPGLHLQGWRRPDGGEAEECSFPVTVTGRGTLAATASRGERLRSDTATLRYDVHEGMYAQVTYGRQYSSAYTAGGDSALVDGVLGGADHHDGRWQGFAGGDVVLTIDLGRSRAVRELSAGFLQNRRAGIFLPRGVTFELSDDAFDYVELPVQVPGEAGEGVQLRGVRVDAGGRQARYIRMHADGMARIPEGHPLEGHEAWLFLDEIIIR